MIFIIYDIERSKRNRGDLPEEHKLMTAPPHAKRYKGNIYIHGISQHVSHISSGHALLVAGNRHEHIVILIDTTRFVNVVMGSV